MELNRVWKTLLTGVLNFLLRQGLSRAFLLKKGEEKLYQYFVVSNPDNRPPGVQEGRYLMLRNLLRSINKAFSDGRISPKVSEAIISNFIGRLLLDYGDCTSHFLAKYGIYPPFTLTISPTKRCNLHCKGCYAASSSDSAETLSFNIFDRIINEKKELWGSYFTVISGGEPLMYRDGDKTLFDILEKHRDNYFMMYTNSTLITKDVAARMADLGNISPAISVEGFEKETDERRGKGTFNRIMRAMDNLRDAGVPFGISVTATRYNVNIIMSKDFTDYYFNQVGAIYGWIFQYMPIGRSYTTDLMITPEQRLALFKQEQRMIREFGLMFADFWNSGPYALGCISAGRPGGYFYIDWNGNVSPCAFFPYYIANIYDVYKENKTLNDILFSPLFNSIHQWQNEYGYTRSPDKVENWIVPCIIRDHFDKAYSLIKEFNAKPMDANAAYALQDKDYHDKMREYGEAVACLTRNVWESEFLGISRQKKIA